MSFQTVPKVLLSPASCLSSSCSSPPNQQQLRGPEFAINELRSRSSSEMNASAAASAAAIALALDLKPKTELQQQQSQTQLQPQQQQPPQKIKKCNFRQFFHTSIKSVNFIKNCKKSGKVSKCQNFNSNELLRVQATTTTATINKLNSIQEQMLAKNSVIAYHDTMTKEQFLFTLDLLAVVRRNASDKLKLIQMVHDNPILWDSRLPNFKGAEEEKNRAWEMIGKKCNAPGKRVARAFKSLRESYRRELAHVKLMGNGFKPKWSLYEAMDFLRDVIRERK